MRVTRLEIFGFKSFVERFALNFDENIIGVVGPNGCGKSNIVDALRWVLGETQARQLRGGTLEDLIFSGSESRRPLGMAEVSITIRPDDGWGQRLPESLSVNESVNGGSVNGAGHGSAARAGLEELEASSEDVEDQAAGSSASGKLAEGQLEQEEISTNELVELEAEMIQPQSLLDIPGIFEVAEIQLTRRLYRSGESEYFINRVACRLRDMVDLYRLIGLGSRGLSIVQQGQIGELISKKPVERRELLEEAAGISGFRARIETAQRKIERTAENMARLNDIILEVEKQVRVLKRQATRAKARNELRQDLETAELELFSLKVSRIICARQDLIEKGGRLQQQIDSVRSRLTEADSVQEEQKGRVVELDVELIALRRRRDELYQELVREREKIQQLKLELGLLEGRERSLASELESDQRRQQGLVEEREQRISGLGALEQKLAEISEEKVRIEAELVAVQQRVSAELESGIQGSESSLDLSAEDNARLERIAELSADVERLVGVSEEHKRSEQVLRELRGKLHGARDSLSRQQVAKSAIDSEIRSLERQLRAISEQAARQTGLTEENPTGNSTVTAAGEALAARLRIPQELQRAATAVLGEKAHYILSSAPYELALGFEQNKARSGAGKSSRIGVIDQEPTAASVFIATPLSQEEMLQAPSALIFADLLNLDAAARRVFEALVGEVIFVESLSEGASLNASNKSAGRPGRTLVSRDGEVITPWGWFATQGEGLGLGMARRIEELKAAAVQAAAEEQRLQQAVSEQVEAEQQSAMKISELTQERERLIANQRELSQLFQVEQEQERRQRAEQIRREREIRDAALVEERKAQQAVRQVDAQVAQQQSALDFELRRIERLEQEIAQLCSSRETKVGTQEQLAAECQELAAKLSGATTGQASEQSQVLRSEFESLEQQLEKIEQVRAEINLELAEAAQHVSVHRREMDALTREHNAAELSQEKLQLEFASICEENRRHYGEKAILPELEQARQQLEIGAEVLAQKLAELSEESDKLRRRLEREGEVDPQSIELFETESERLEQMKAQYADLDSARKTLDRTIRQLKNISRERFLTTFKDVSGKFTELIPQLFGGGAGHLSLINPEDPLTSGVEITVRPPGKRITSMELLSGGEKALVATAVLIAMFLHRPSPICVLDEVDAPLDDANLDRFISVIKGIAHTTQFLIITHNKATMSAVDRLLGITMQESGVSTALSVTFAEAEAELERWAVNS